MQPCRRYFDATRPKHAPCQLHQARDRAAFIYDAINSLLCQARRSGKDFCHAPVYGNDGITMVAQLVCLASGPLLGFLLQTRTPEATCARIQQLFGGIGAVEISRTADGAHWIQATVKGKDWKLLLRLYAVLADPSVVL